MNLNAEYNTRQNQATVN